NPLQQKPRRRRGFCFSPRSVHRLELPRDGHRAQVVPSEDALDQVALEDPVTPVGQVPRLVEVAPAHQLEVAGSREPAAIPGDAAAMEPREPLQVVRTGVYGAAAVY